MPRLKRDKDCARETLRMMTEKIFHLDLCVREGTESNRREKNDLLKKKKFKNIPCFHDAKRKRESKRKRRMRDWNSEWKTESRIMNSSTCHMLLRASLQLNFPSLCIRFSLHLLPLVLHHHFVLLSFSLYLALSTCISTEYFNWTTVESLNSSRKSLRTRLNLMQNCSTSVSCCQCMWALCEPLNNYAKQRPTARCQDKQDKHGLTSTKYAKTQQLEEVEAIFCLPVFCLIKDLILAADLKEFQRQCM